MEKITTTLQNLISYSGLNENFSSILLAIITLILGWIIAKFIKKLIYKVLTKSKWDSKLMGDSAKEIKVNELISKFVYYIIMIVVLLSVLEIMGIRQVLDPIKNMLNEFLTFIPNIVAAAVVGFVGYIIAKIVSNLVALAGNFIDKMAEKTGFKDTDKLVSIITKVLFILIFIPFLIQALNILNLTIITNPANDILNSILHIIPKLLGAAVIIALFVVGGRYLTNFIHDFLKSMGADALAEKLQLDTVMGNSQSLSKMISNLLYFFLVFFGIITGVELLELSKLSEILDTISSLTGQILFGVLILIIGNFIATIIHNVLSKADNNKFIASIVRYAVMALFFAMALRTMGIANSIIDLAFGLILGAIAVAVALSYGLGGREAAGEHMKDIIAKLKNKK